TPPSNCSTALRSALAALVPQEFCPDEGVAAEAVARRVGRVRDPPILLCLDTGHRIIEEGELGAAIRREEVAGGNADEAGGRASPLAQRGEELARDRVERA